MHVNINDYDVLTFDCYGTLIDWETGILNALKPLTDQKDRMMTKDEILEAHARMESMQQRETPAMPYSRLLAVVYKRLAEQWGLVVSWDECEKYGESVADWPAFPDSAASLRRLKRRFRLGILSNVDNRSFNASARKLDTAFDFVFTAEDIGSYKPALKNFDYMLNILKNQGVAKSDILHVAESMFHDHEPANKMSMSTCRIFRRHGRDGFGATMQPESSPRFDFDFNNMAELADACGNGGGTEEGHSN